MRAKEKSGLTVGFFFPSAFGGFRDQAFFDGARSDPHVAYFSVDHRFDALKIWHKTALGYGRDVGADAAAFLGLATAPNDAALHWPLAGQFTNSCHKNSCFKLRTTKS